MMATQTRYDVAGNVAQVTKDPGGLAITVTSSSDPWGNLLAGRSALGYTTSYSRDASGRTLLTARTDPGGHLLAQTENSWDVYGELTQTKALFGTNPTDDGSKTISQTVRNYSGSIVVVDSVGDTRTDYSTSALVQAGSRVEYNTRGLIAYTYVCDQWDGSSSWGKMYVSKAFTYDWAGRVTQESVYADNGTGSPYLAQSTTHAYDTWVSGDSIPILALR
jgi:YD repeat-containing protein